jgi:SagB-type dehydrogenase family enzyme
MAILLTLAPGARVAWADGGDGAELHGPGGGVAAVSGGGMAAALARLADGPAAEADLVRAAREAEGAAALPTLFHHLRAWTAAGWLRLAVHDDAGRALAAAACVAPHLALSAAPAHPERALALSRFALVRAEGGRAWLESPRSPLRVCLEAPEAAAAVLRLARPATPARVAADAGLSPGAAADLLGLLHGAALAVEHADGVPSPEEADPGLAHWEFHDLLFHARSRVGRQAGGYGGTYRMEGRFPPLPAVRPPFAGAAVPLPRPDLDAVAEGDPPFTRVLEERRSVRGSGARAVTLAEVGELLFRAARVRRLIPTPRGELSSRPYPGGGACHELEVYLAVRACDGLEPGLYHYDPGEHRLVRVEGGDPAAVRALLRDSAIVAHGAPPAQVLVVLAARFARVAWKYESMAYALVLKDAGVLIQTLYLVATAMGLAPCALGGGNADLFARASGTDYYAEPSVAELRLGAP